MAAERAVEDLRNKLEVFEQGIQASLLKQETDSSMNLAKTQSLYEECKSLFSDQSAKLLYLDSYTKELAAKVATMERAEDGGTRKRQGLVDSKHMQPPVLDDEKVKFVMWKEDMEDYCESIKKNFRTTLRWAREQKTEITKATYDLDCDHSGEMPFHDMEELHQLLKAKTNKEAKRIIRVLKDCNGLEAWRLLRSHHEPKMITTKTALRADIARMIRTPAKRTEEVRTILQKLEEKIRRYENYTNASFDAEEKKGYVTDLLDEETKKHMIQYGGDEHSYDVYKDKISEFINTVGSKNIDNMELDKMQQTKWLWQGQEAGDAWQEQEAGEAGQEQNSKTWGADPNEEQ